MPSDADLSTPRYATEESQWGPLGKPGTRTKEAIIAYVKRNSALPPEGKRAFALNIYNNELAFREGRHYAPQSMTPYPGAKP